MRINMTNLEVVLSTGINQCLNAKSLCCAAANAGERF
jgi:hypothetical protein